MTEQGDLPAALIKGTALGFTPMELHTLLEDYETSKAKMWALSDLAEEGRYHEMYAQGKAWALTAEQVDDIVAPKGVGCAARARNYPYDRLSYSQRRCLFPFLLGKVGRSPTRRIAVPPTPRARCDSNLEANSHTNSGRSRFARQSAWHSCFHRSP